jgi:ATP-dependent Clp protease ATP-binding subunit ClpC
MKDSQSHINPYTLLMAGTAISGGIIGLNKLSIWFSPALFTLALAGMVWIAIQQARDDSRQRREESVVDYESLAKINLARLAPWLKENVRGQDSTIDHIVADLQRNLELARPGRTLGAFLLVGPTGTGKTFLAQLIAESMYPNCEPVILRMNQYKHADDVFTLIGPPPGSPGHEVGGTLTRPVLKNPLRVIILDEIEKCHRDLHHCLYDILDTASCREKSSGNMVDFSGCVFFATCNAAVEALRKIAADYPDMLTSIGKRRDALVEDAQFDRAFLARWNGIHLMDELSPLHVAEVACLQLARHWREYGIELRHASAELILQAVESNEEFKQYGVRQLAAYIQSKTNDAIVQARQKGSKVVELVVAENGNMEVKPCD